MATKSITLDLEAYQRLKAVQRDGESFSQTIKRTIPTPLDIEAYAARVREISMSRPAIEAVEEQVHHRHTPSERNR
jgi:predicted CopG family antitoxin